MKKEIREKLHQVLDMMIDEGMLLGTVKEVTCSNGKFIVDGYFLKLEHRKETQL